MSSTKGFTLLEVMVAVLILLILSLIAVPSFARVIQNNRITATGIELRGAISLARSEALKRSGIVGICPTEDGETCASAEDWSKGWMVFLDQETSSTNKKISATDLIKRWENSNEDIKVVSLAEKEKTFNQLKFDAQGILVRDKQSDTGYRQFNVKVSGCQTGEYMNSITVGYSGLLNSARDACK